ncbi:putative glycerophosphoryl diester phosphodiesterase [Lactobacillus phage c5]|uniref:Glycerophosphoryl diester phosphodiesterase n=1 Tax=Lactobacillus phage c5 TaxID=2892341 RepID=F8J173_9CAUD|nr:phosphodiesterase [Lactobacillus phage c5]ACA63311.2 putative glycerophosphoryl diester phosphodiesterase [Lactobacillus phage c5]
MIDPEVKLLMLKGDKGDGLSDDDMHKVESLIDSNVDEAKGSLSKALSAQLEVARIDDMNQTKSFVTSSVVDAKEDINRTVNARIAGARFIPKGFANADDLKKAYPKGQDGIFVVADTGHMWLFVNGAWKDCGVYQTPVQKNQTFTFQPSKDGFPNYDTATHKLDFRCITDSAQVTTPSGDAYRIPQYTVVDVNWEFTTGVIIFDTNTLSVISQSPYIPINANQYVLASYRRYPAEGDRLTWNGVLAQSLLINGETYMEQNVQFVPSKDGLPYYDSKRKIINFNCLTDQAYVSYQNRNYTLPHNATVALDFSRVTSFDILIDMKTGEVSTNDKYRLLTPNMDKVSFATVRLLNNGKVAIEGIKLLDEVSPKNSTGILPIAHRGLNSIAPEESLEAYSLAVRSGYKDIECDIYFTEDGIPVLHHDATINSIARNSDGTELTQPVKIGERMLVELNAYDYGIYKSEIFKGLNICTFEDIIKFARRTGATVHAELKQQYTDEQCQVLLDIVSKYRMANKVGWQAFDHSSLGYIASHDENAQLELLAGSITDDLIAEGKKRLNGKRKVVLSVGQGVTQRLVDQAHSEGFDVYVWTVDDIDGAKKLINMGVDGIMTNGHIDLPNLLSSDYDLQVSNSPAVDLVTNLTWYKNTYINGKGYIYNLLDGMKDGEERTFAPASGENWFSAIVNFKKNTYTLSFAAKSTVNTDNLTTLMRHVEMGDNNYNCVTSVNGTPVNSISWGDNDLKVSDSYTRYSVTYTANPDNKPFQIGFRTSSSTGTVSIKNIRLTVGTETSWGATVCMMSYLDANQGETYYARQLEEGAWLNAPMVVTNDNLDAIPSTVITDGENHTVKITIPSGGTKLFLNSNETLVPMVFKQSASSGI